MSAAAGSTRVESLQEEIKKLQQQLKKGAASDLAGTMDKLLAGATKTGCAGANATGCGEHGSAEAAGCGKLIHRC